MARILCFLLRGLKIEKHDKNFHAESEKCAWAPACQFFSGSFEKKSMKEKFFLFFTPAKFNILIFNVSNAEILARLDEHVHFMQSKSSHWNKIIAVEVFVSVLVSIINSISSVLRCWNFISCIATWSLAGLKRFNPINAHKTLERDLPAKVRATMPSEFSTSMRLTLVCYFHPVGLTTSGSLSTYDAVMC